MPSVRTLPLWLLLSANAGCFAPTYGSPSFACGKGSQCPYGYECGNDGLCYEAGLTPDGVGAADAHAFDAMVVPRTDAAGCDGDCTPDAMVGGEDCPAESDVVVDITHSGGAYTGTTTGTTSNFVPTCTSSSTAGDVVHRFVLPGDAHVTFSLCGGASWDTVLYVKDSCDDATLALGCNDDDANMCGGTIFLLQSVVALDLTAGTYFVVVDGYLDASGEYTLQVTGTIADGAPCDPEQVSDAFLQCNPGKSCTSVGGGARACM